MRGNLGYNSRECSDSIIQDEMVEDDESMLLLHTCSTFNRLTEHDDGGEGTYYCY